MGDRAPTGYFGITEKGRRNLLEKCRIHTLPRSLTGIWNSPGVKANVIFFDKYALAAIAYVNVENVRSAA